MKTKNLICLAACLTLLLTSLGMAMAQDKESSLAPDGGPYRLLL